MKILVLNWRDTVHPRSGGAEVYVHQVARRWVEDGHAVRQFSAAVPGAPAEETIDGISITRRGGAYGVYREAARLLRGDDGRWPDIVVDCINTRPFMAPRLVACPVVAVVHQVCREVWFDEFAWPVAVVGRFVLEPLWLRPYRNVPTMTLSLSSMASLRRYGLRSIYLVAPGTELPAPSAVAKEEVPTMAFVGRLVENKRPDHAIEALRELRWRFPDARLWIIGSGPLEDRLRSTAPPGVTFWGRVSEQEKVDLLARAHVLIATSRREGWGLTVTEAAAVGTPAVCYDIAGLRDSVAATGIGRLCPPRPAAMAAAVATLLDTAAIPPVMPRSWDLAARGCLEVMTSALMAADPTMGSPTTGEHSIDPC